MLLRSTSTPILKTYACQVSNLDTDPTRPVSMAFERTSSEGELRLLKMLPKSRAACARSSVVFKEKEEMSVCMEAAAALVQVDEEYEEEKIVYAGGGRGGGDSDGSGGGDGWWVSGYNGPNGKPHMDEYYQSMIKLYPGDALLLANYAKFLKEVKGDNVKAEEVCERAILANASEGNVLSMYGDLIWKNHKNSDRANMYFDQAVLSSPDDCYVLASYARFLWDAEEEEKEDEDSDEEFQFSHNLSQEEFKSLVAAT